MQEFEFMLNSKIWMNQYRQTSYRTNTRERTSRALCCTSIKAKGTRICKSQIDIMLEMKETKLVETECVSAIVFPPNKDGSCRICVDYR